MGDLEVRMYPFLRFSSKNSSSAFISLGVREYTGQSFISNPGFSLMAWSYGLCGGNLSAAFYSKMCLNSLQYSGIFNSGVSSTMIFLI